jgi:hypothetical protein
MSFFDSVGKFFEGIFGSIGDIFSWLLGLPDEDDYKGQLLNENSNIANIPVIYGERLVGGTRAFLSTGGNGDNQFLYMALTLSEGEVDSIGDIYVNDKVLGLQNVIGKTYQKNIYGDYKDIIWTQKFTGTDAQTSCAAFFDDFGSGPDDNWGANHKLNGVAYLAIVIRYHEDKSMTSIPEVRCVVKGRKVFDPRNGTTSWSDNPALCLRDYLTNQRYGKGLSSASIDDDSFEAAADFCDSTYTSYIGGPATNPFNINMILDTGKTLFKNTGRILTAMRGIMPYTEGKYSLIIDKQESSVGTITNDIITKDISIKSTSKDKKLNQIKVTFVNPYKRWEQDNVIWPMSGSSDESTFLAEDNQQVLSKDIDLDTVTSYYQARELARVAVLSSRATSIIVEVTCTSEALQYAVGDVISLEQESMGWTGAAIKDFRIMSMQLSPSGEVGLTLQEYDSAIYPWVVDVEQDEQPQTTLPNPSTVQPLPSDPVVTTNAEVMNDGTIQYYADLTWTAPNDALVSEYIVQINKKVGAVTTENIETIKTRNTAAKYIITDSNAEYGVTVRAVNGSGSISDAKTALPVAITLDTTAPQDITNFAAVGKLQQVELKWTNPSDADFDLVNVKVSDDTTEPSEIYAQVRSSSYTHEVGAYSTTKNYWVAPVDTSGNVGSYTGPQSATTGSIAIGDVPSVAGTFYLTLDDDGAPTDAEFLAAVNRNPTSGDFVVVNKEFAFTRNGTTWNTVTEFIDGSLLVTGSLSASDITTGTLNANDVTISNLTIGYGSVTGTPDLSSFITGGDVNANVTSISGGVIQTGTALTVGTGDNVAIVSGADATYRIWAGDATAADAPFRVTQTGVMHASGAQITGNLSAGSIDVDNLNIVGTLTADQLTTIPIVEGENFTQSAINKIEEIIVSKFGSDSGSGSFGSATGSFDINDDDTVIATITDFTHNDSDVTIEVTFSKAWQASAAGVPSVVVKIERKPSSGSTWTTIKTQTIQGSAFLEPELNTYFANISGYVTITEDSGAAGDYDYRFKTGQVLNLSTTTITNAKIEANEQGSQIGTIDLASYGALADNETVTGDWTFNGTTSGIDYSNIDSTPDLSVYANKSGDTFTGTVRSTKSTIGSIGGSPNMSNAGFLAGSTSTGVGIDSNEIVYVGTGTSYLNAVHDAGFEIHTGSGATNNAKRVTINNTGLTVHGSLSATGYNKSNWDTAYGWGNHASAGYLTSLSSHNHDDRYYTETESDSRFANITGDTFTGNLQVNGGYLQAHGLFYLRDDLNFINAAANGWHTIIEKNGGNPYFNAIDSYRVGGTTVIDSSRNLTNIGSISASGGISVSGYNTISSYAGSFANLSLSGGLTVSNVSTIDAARNASFASITSTGANEIVKDGDSLLLRSTSASAEVGMRFTSQGASATQFGHIRYNHSNAASYGAGEVFTIGGTESSTVILADGQFYYKDGIYRKPASGTGAGTRKDTNWDTAYTYSQVGHLPLTHDMTLTLSGDATGSATFTNMGNATLSVAVANDSHSHSNYLPLSGGTITGNVTFTGADGENALTLSGTSPTLAFTDTGSEDDFYIHVNSNNFYILRDTAGVGNYGAWNSPHAFQLESDTNIGYLFGNRIFADNYHPNSDKWTTARTITLSGDLTGSVSIDGSANVTLSGQVVNDSHTHDGRYFTEAESDGRYLNRSSSVESNLDTKYDADLFGFGPSTTGRPENYGQGISIVSSGNTHNNSNNWITQLAFGTSANSAYFRTKVNANGWTAWRTIWHSGNFATGSDARNFGSLQINGTTVIDSSRNLTSIGNIDAKALTNQGSGLRVVNPDGASYATTNSSVVGAIKITLPVSWTSTMMRMTIKVYEYTMDESFEVEVGGYTYGSGSTWINTTAKIIGSPNKGRNYNVRFGHDGSKCCIYIGEVGSNWSYPQVAVTDFYAGFQGYSAGTWNDGWDVTFATTLGTITKTHSNVEVGIDGYEKRIGGVTVIDSSRNLTNIGTVSTSGRLTITDATAGNGSWTGGILIHNTSSTAGEPAIAFKNSAMGSNQWIVGSNQDNEMHFSYGTDFTDSGTKVVIKSDGKMGIGVGAGDLTNQLTVGGNTQINGNISTGTGGSISAFSNVTASNGFVKSGSGGFYVSNNQIVDSGRNLLNIGNITCSGTNNTYGEINIREDVSAPGYTFMRFQSYSTGATLGSIYRSYGSMVYSTSSDYRLKENVVALAGASAKVMALPVRRFNFIAHPERTVDGFLAHEVAEVVPEAVLGEKDAVDSNGKPVYQGIDQSKLVPLLTAGLQEALAEIENLKARLSALEN